jgi:hypothetical protein
MTYNEFIQLLETHQTANVKCLSFPGCSAPSPIPNEFMSLLPEIIKVLDNNIRTFCKEDQVLAIIGLQLGPPMMRSRTPEKLNRFIHKAYPHQHFCCVLQYMIVNRDDLENTTCWQGAQTLMVDFTTGDVMDGQRYIFRVLGDAPEGTVYGTINDKKLAAVWQTIADNRQPYPLAKHPSFNHLALASNF